MLIQLEQARDRITPVERLLADAHEAAASKWSHLVQNFPGFAADLDATARASCFHCHVRAEIDQRIAGRTDVAVNDRLGFFALWLAPDVLLRIKYVGNSDGAPHNYPTNQQRMLARQRYDTEMLELLGVDAPPHF